MKTTIAPGPHVVSSEIEVFEYYMDEDEASKHTQKLSTMSNRGVFFCETNAL